MQTQWNHNRFSRAIASMLLISAVFAACTQPSPAPRISSLSPTAPTQSPIPTTTAPPTHTPTPSQTSTRTSTPTPTSTYTPTPTLTPTPQPDITTENIQKLTEIKRLNIGFPVWKMAFSPDGNELVLSSYNDIQVWDANTLQKMVTFHAHDDVIRSLEISPNGREIISADKHAVKFWDIFDGQPLKQIPISRNANTVTIAISPDGNLLAVSTDDCGSKKDYFCGDLTLWDLSSGSIIKYVDLGDTYTGLEFSTDGQSLIATSPNRGVSRFSYPDLVRQVSILEGYLTTSRIYPRTTRISPSGYSYTVLLDEQSKKNSNEIWGGIYILNSQNYQVIRKFEQLQESAGRDVQYFPQSDFVLFSDGTRTTITSAADESISVVLWHDSQVMSSAVSPNGKLLVTSTLFGDLVFWGIGEQVLQTPTPVPTWESNLALQLYDDFERDILDPAKWKVTLPHAAKSPRVQQENGSLFVQAEKGNENFHTDMVVLNRKLDRLGGEAEAFEIKVRIPDQRNGHGNDQSVYAFLSAPLPNGVTWAAKCALSALLAGPYFQCSVEGSKTDARFNEYESGMKRLRTDVWYKVRIEIDRRSGAVQFYLDDDLFAHYDSYHAAAIESAPLTPGIGVSIQSYVDGSLAQALFDDAMITEE